MFNVATIMELAISIINYKHNHELSIEEAIEEICYKSSVTQVKAIQVRLTPPALANKSDVLQYLRLLQRLCLYNSFKLPDLLHYIPKVLSHTPRSTTIYNEVFLDQLFISLDSIFINSEDINQLRMIHWFLLFIQWLLIFIMEPNDNVSQEFTKLIITKIIEHIFNIVIEDELVWSTLENTDRFKDLSELKKYNKIEINKESIPLHIIVYLQILNILHEKICLSDHLKILSILLLYNNDFLTNYYQLNSNHIHLFQPLN